MTIGWGLLRMTIANCFPRHIPILSYVTAIVVLLAIAVVAFATDIVRSKIGYLAYVFGGVLIFLAFVLVVMLCLYSNEVKFQGYMLEYATKFLDQNTHTFLYLPFFIIFHIGLVLLVVFQHFSFSSHQFTAIPNLGNFNFRLVLEILNLIEYLWGLQFLKDACKLLIQFRQLLCEWKRCRLVLDRKEQLLCSSQETPAQKLGQCCLWLFSKRISRNPNPNLIASCMSSGHMLLKTGCLLLHLF